MFISKKDNNSQFDFDSFRSQVSELVSGKESFSGSMSSEEGLSGADRALMRKTFDTVCQFVNDNSLFSKSMAVSNNLFQTTQGCESLNPEVNVVSQIGASKLQQLCIDCGVPEKHHEAAIMSLGNMMLKMKAASENMALYREAHFSSVQDSVAGKSLRVGDIRSILPSSLHSEFLRDAPGVEAFGAEIDRVIPDIRVAFTVTLLKFHRSLVDRVMHRRVNSSTIIKYVVPYAEVYDLMKSMDQKAAVRNGIEHRYPFIDLYGDPHSVVNKLKLIVPLKTNDTNGAVLRDGILVPGVKSNLFDLSRQANVIGNNHTDYWDLIADGVIIDYVILEVKDNSNTEEFRIPVRGFSRSRLQQVPNPLDSADRSTILNQTFKFHKNTLTGAGVQTQIFANIEPDNCVAMDIDLAVQINLKWHTVSATAGLTARSYVQDGTSATAGPVTTVLGDIAGKIKVAGYALDARYSEENLRKTSVAIRSHFMTKDYEIPVGRNYVVDYALNEALPEYVMGNVTAAINIGQDARLIETLMRTLMDVYDRTHEENADPNFRDTLLKIGHDFVAGQQVRPTVYLGAIDLEQVDTIRSSDILGDIRQFTELQLVNLISLLHQNSYYKTQLNPGEKVCYKVITSPVIMENILNVPHIHNHLQAGSQDNLSGDGTEFTRVLPNGVVLDCVTTTFNFMRDKMIVVPYRQGDPESVLNVGHNWDYGTYIAHYTPQIANGVAKRVFANARELPVITNPCGLLIEVQNISRVINMFQIANSRPGAGIEIPVFTGKLPDKSGLKGPQSRIGRP